MNKLKFLRIIYLKNEGELNLKQAGKIRTINNPLLV